MDKIVEIYAETAQFVQGYQSVSKKSIFQQKPRLTTESVIHKHFVQKTYNPAGTAQ